METSIPSLCLSSIFFTSANYMEIHNNEYLRKIFYGITFTDRTLEPFAGERFIACRHQLL